MMLKENIQVNFIIGVEGSGTTMMSRIFGYTKGSEVILGNHLSVHREKETAFQRVTGLKQRSELGDVLRSLEQSTALMWSRKNDIEKVKSAQSEFLQALETFVDIPEYNSTEHIFLKRSAPFYTGDEYRPDLFDIQDLLPNSKILVMIRDPRASSYSALRRGFVDNIRYSAIVCEEQLMLIEMRLRQMDRQKFLVVNYEGFCSDPNKEGQRIASFFGLNEKEFLKSIAKEKVSSTKNDAWRKKLTEKEVRFLDEYFDKRRMAQFDVLKFNAEN
ncbi:MAG: sulfotransferase [Bacteroidia bacterium]|nr:sulfotransferase [Bacteroidia bacterium]